jgi:hypothetical protein
MHKSNMPLENYGRPQKKVRAKFGHMWPELQRLIGKPLMQVPAKKILDSETIRGARRAKIAGAAAESIFWAAVVGAIGAGTGGGASPLAASGAGAVGGAIASEAAFSEAEQARYNQIIEIIRKKGVIRPKYVQFYPPGWTRASGIAKTHPVLSVARNGDIKFRRLTSAEKMRFNWQQTQFGSAGIAPWRWRGYIEQPSRPAKKARPAREKPGAMLKRIMAKPHAR